MNTSISISKGAEIIERAQSVGLDPSTLYEAVIDLSSQGLVTANCINMAAGILLEDLGLPMYFFQHIKKAPLTHLLNSIATSIKIIDGKETLYGRVAHVDFDLDQDNETQRVRIATEETLENLEAILEEQVTGHRREYYFSPKSRYYTYIIRPETVDDFDREDYRESKFLFTLAGDYTVTPEPTRRRYVQFLESCEKSSSPLIEVFNLPETGETRLMFNNDFEKPEIPVLRKILADHDYTLVRAYWEPYITGTSVHASVCAMYIDGELTRKKEAELLEDLSAFLAFSNNPVTDLYLQDKISFQEMLFIGNAVDFCHLFIFNESENAADAEILQNLEGKDQKEAFARRIHGSNKSTYGWELIVDTVLKNHDLIPFLYELFAGRFKPGKKGGMSLEALEEKREKFDRLISSRFIDFPFGKDIFRFIFKLISATLKTNFYKTQKRSFAFRFDAAILDPLVFDQFVFGIFFVNGHYSCGTHLRAGDISRGGLRLIRVSDANYASELDNAVLLNYALGPKAQRLKHKDICESGSKGVVVPHPHYSQHPSQALSDYTEGILDLVQPDEAIRDYYNKPEMIFFGPDEGTAPLMDNVAYSARERDYRYWRTLTTGKSFGIPHDTYGLLDNGDLFGLYSKGEEGVELQVNGTSELTTRTMEEISEAIGNRIETSGMTTTSVMSCFRTLIGHFGKNEQDLNLMMTGGPDGDLGANQLQCYKGKICLIIDGGSILFDPEGLDREALLHLAFKRNSNPRENSQHFPVEKLSSRGFMVPVRGKNITLPDGRLVEDGAVFHRNFLTNVQNRELIKEAGIEAFIPCGGFKDTINRGNIKEFLAVFNELEFIVEGANVFFDDASRRYIASSTAIKQVKDSTANKGGVFSSSIAEVLTAFLFQDGYEENLLNDQQTRWGLIGDMIALVDKYSRIETSLLLKIHEQDPETPLFMLSEQTSESIFSFQDSIEERLEEILADETLVWAIIEQYVPSVLITKMGREAIMQLLNSQELQPYRDAILTKKMASLAFYRNGLQWDTFLKKIEKKFLPSLYQVLDLPVSK